MTGDPHGGYIADPQSLNRYSYTRDNPIRFTDPNGMDGPCDQPGGWCLGNTPGSGSGDPGYGFGFLSNDTCLGGFAGCGGPGGLDDPTSLRWCMKNIAHGKQGICRPLKPAKKTPTSRKDDCAATRLAAAMKGLINLGVAYQKAEGTIASGASSGVDGPIGMAGAMYLGIGAAGNFIAGIAQLTGAITGDTNRNAHFATGASTLTTVLGYSACMKTGNLDTASSWAAAESLGTAGFQGGMTGRMIDSVAGFGDLAQNAADFVGLDTSGTCHQ